MVTYHLLNKGISRFEKFRHYYENILKIPMDEEKLIFLGKEFSKIVLDEVIASPFIPGAMETLEELKRLNISSYLVSGTPDEEMLLIVETKGLSLFFEEVHGSPRLKDEIIIDLLHRKGYEPSKCLFIGDAMTDYNAAQKTGTCFLGIVKDGERSPFPDGTWISSSIKLLRVGV